MKNNNLEKLDEIPDVFAKAINYVFENNLVSDDGLWLEFGVHAAGTLNRIAKYTKRPIVFGFDSFEGLPEDWHGRLEPNGVSYPKGTFSLGGWMPAVPPHVSLVKGWYKDTLPAFLATHKDSVAFLHVDSDIYSSAKDIFNNLKTRIRHNCTIVFDELVGYPAFEQHEWKAWWEFVEENNIAFEWIGGNKSGKVVLPTDGRLLFDRERKPTENVSPSHENVAVKIINNPSFVE